MGSTSIRTGRDVIGQVLDCPIDDGMWWARRTSNLRLLQFAYSLAYNAMNIPMVNLADLADIGFGARHRRIPVFKRIYKAARAGLQETAVGPEIRGSVEQQRGGVAQHVCEPGLRP